MFGKPEPSQFTSSLPHSSHLSLNLLKLHRWRIAGAEVNIPATHFLDRAVALFSRREPVFLGPVAADQIFERIRRASFDAEPERKLFGDRSSEVVFVANRHGRTVCYSVSGVKKPPKAGA